MDTQTLLNPKSSRKLKLEPPKAPDFLVFGQPDIGQEEIDAVTSVMRSKWLSTGSVVKEFEEEFEKFVGDGHAVAVASCTAALRLSMMVSNVGCGNEVITTPLTYAATVNSILSVDAKPVFVDVTSNGQIDVDQIESKITDKTKAIIPVHYTGCAADTKRILEIARRYRLAVIEDSAHGFDGWHVEPMVGSQPGHRQRIGTMGDFSCFSFYSTKNITCGEGGMVICRNRELAERIKMLTMQGLSSGAWRRYGKDPIRPYEVVYAGQKANLSDIHASIGLTQLRRWPEMKAKRNVVWDIYEDAFGLKEPGHSKHLFTIRNPRRDQLRQHLYEKGIGTGIHFKALHLEPAYASMRHNLGDFPKAERIGMETVSLPVTPNMTAEDANRVVSAIKEFMGKGNA